ncbi:MAG: YicC family protein [Oscillospiraceae bacterium]|nr:YicC family protein [Oscillospiraceae bacterium]
MVRSMTGFGRAQRIVNGRDITVEVRSVNHRYYEFSARVPRSCAFLEEKLKGYSNARVARGKVEISVIINLTEARDTLISANTEIAKGYLEALRKANKELGLTDDITLSHIMRLPDIFLITKAPENEEQIWEDVKGVADEALATFVSMREREGRRLRDDVLERLDVIDRLVAQIEEISPRTVENYRSRLYAKLCEVLAQDDIDESRLVTEAAVFADKVATAEETVRLKSHIRQLVDMLDSNEPIGRKADFLIQEFNREANTIGSKAQDVSVTKLVVDLKSEIEKIREQIQNIE